MTTEGFTPMQNISFISILSLLCCKQSVEGGFATVSGSTTNQQTSDDNLSIQNLQFILVETSSFVMGSPETENGRQHHPGSDSDAEVFEHQYQASFTQNFLLSETEVTRELFH
jgi:hypothetical protein